MNFRAGKILPIIYPFSKLRSVKSKNRIAQENELLCKIIAYNITVLIHEMIQLNGTSEFLSFDGLQKEETLKQSNGYRMMEES